MATKRAKTLEDDQFQTLWDYISANSSMPARDHLIVALSFKAGLRVAEITKIDLSAMTDASDRISSVIHIFSNVGKKQRERSIPMHPMIKKALTKFRATYPNAKFVAISSQPFRWILAHGEPVPANATFKRMSVTAMTNYYCRLLQAVGFEGATTHSGRRTFGTRMARNANLHHCSIRDVQILMGHARLETTEEYIELSKDAKDLIAAI